MIRIGFVDRYLDNWHSNYYPDFIKEAAKLYDFDIALTAAYADMDHPNGGISTDTWCQNKEVKRSYTYKELVESVDAIMVMCADDCYPHEELANIALKSGKPVYCDKTFAPTLEAAIRMFNLADSYKTPLFSSSAQRFCSDLIKFMDEKKTPAVFCATTGPGDMVNYSIHQFEMLECIMGVGAKECKAFSAGNVSHIIYKYENNLFATFTQSPNVNFTMHVSDGLSDGKPDKNPVKNSSGRSIAVSDYYMNFMKALFNFFTDKIPPASRNDTLEIMAMQQAGREALKTPDTWVKITEDRL